MDEQLPIFLCLPGNIGKAAVKKGNVTPVELLDIAINLLNVDDPPFADE